MTNKELLNKVYEIIETEEEIEDATPEKVSAIFAADPVKVLRATVRATKKNILRRLKAEFSEDCVCGEINSRNCPVHGGG